MPPADPTGETLKARIVAEIRANGPISVARYFEIAVADPREGYWQRRAIIGSAAIS